MPFIGVQPATVPLTSSDITDGIITTAKIADTAVSTAKIADDAVGNTKLDLSANYTFTGTITGVNTPSFLATRGSSDQTITANSWVKLQFNEEIYDNGGDFDHSSTYRFTPNVAGTYYVFMNLLPNLGNTHTYGGFYFNGSGYFPLQIADASQAGGVFIGNLIVFNGSSDYIEAYTYQGVSTGNFESASQYNVFGAFKVI